MFQSESSFKRLVETASDLPRSLKRIMMAASDFVMLVMSIVLAFYLRLGTWDLAFEPVMVFAAYAVPIATGTMWLCGAYQAIFRFVGAGMMSTLVRAYMLYALITIAIFGLVGVPGVPRTVSLIQPLVFFALAVGTRTVLGFMLLEGLGRRFAPDAAQIALIYGAGETGQQLMRAIRSDKSVKIVGYLDDDARLKNHKLDGQKIYGADNLGEALRKTGTQIVLLAMPSLSRTRRKEIVENLTQYSVEVRTIPSMRDLVGGEITIDEVQPVALEDLLGRDPVEPNEVLMARTLLQKSVLVTGAGGSIGSELCRQIVLRNPKRIILADMTEAALFRIERELQEWAISAASPVEIVAELLNATNPHAVDRLFSRYKPDTVFHAAAYKHVPLVEENILTGLQNNIVATEIAAKAAINHGTSHFILISTDKAVRPTNVMGASKRVCELILQALSANGKRTNFAMVRFGNVLGSSGSVVPHFMAQIKQGGPVTLTHREITRYFMTIPEAAQLVIQACAMARGGEVFLLDMGQPVKIYDLAESMIRLSGLEVKSEDNPAGDIEIREVGLRPGEKLYEELLIDAASEPTGHPRIMRGRERSLPLATLEGLTSQLKETFITGDLEQALAILSTLVPEYTPDYRDHAADNDRAGLTGA